MNLQNLVTASQAGDAKRIDEVRNALVNAAVGDQGGGVNINISGSVGAGVKGKVDVVGGAANALVKAVQSSDLAGVKSAVVGIVNGAK